MTLAEDIMQEWILDRQIEAEREGVPFVVEWNPPKKGSDLYYLREIVTFFSLLDDEHKSRACDVLNDILHDQIEETGKE